MHFLFLLLSVFLAGIFAGSNAQAENIQTPQSEHLRSVKLQALSNGLADQRIWHALLHYRRDQLAPNGYSSYVDDDDFFYSERGAVDAENELLRTIEAFFSRQEQGNEHAQCRFVLRFEWLHSQLLFDRHRLPRPECSDYRQWREQVNAHSVSLIFPSTVLNSPSSMFGHTLLRFDPENVEKGSTWLSHALNFGANVNNDENSIFYAFRGLAGGYPGVYNMMRYFKKIKEYNRMENRDIWEYRLNFTAAEVDRMLAHVWELKDISFDYYFFDENCAFRLLELMELVRPELDLISQFTLHAIPTDTVRAVKKAGLVESTYFRPSELALLNTRINALPKNLQQTGFKLASDIGVLDSPGFLALPEEDQAEVIQVAYSYLRYKQLQTQRKDEMARRSHQLLLALNKTTSKDVKVARPQPPETGHKTTHLGLVAGERDDDFYQQLNYRTTYHDLLDNERGYLRGAQIILFNTELRHYQDAGFKLNRLDLVDITSLSKRNLFLKPLSWKVQTGYERVFSRHGDTGVYQLSGGAGHSYELTENSELYGLISGRLEYNESYSSFIEPALGLTTGLLYYGKAGTQQVDVNGYKFLNEDYRIKASFNQNLNLGVNHAIRFSLAQEWYRKDNLAEISLSYRYYF